MSHVIRYFEKIQKYKQNFLYQITQQLYISYNAIYKGRGSMNSSWLVSPANTTKFINFFATKNDAVTGLDKLNQVRLLITELFSFHASDK